MRVKIKNDLLVVKVGFFDSSVIFALPMLLLPFINESHYQYVHLYVILAALYIVLYVKERINPVVYLNNKSISFRKAVKNSYINGFLKHEGMTVRVMTIQLKNVSNVEFKYPTISIFEYGEQYKIVLKLNENDFSKIGSEMASKLKKFDTPCKILKKGLKKY